MSETYTDEDLRNGNVDPGSILRGEAVHEDVPEPDDANGPITEGTATTDDLEAGRVDPGAVVRGDVSIGTEDAVHVRASDLQDEAVQQAYSEQDHVVVHLDEDEETNQHAETWADKHGATVTETAANV